MKFTKKVIIGSVVIVALGTAGYMSLNNSRERGIAVRMEKVETRNLVSTVTASGKIRARQSVDISSDVMGRVIELNVKEGEEVEEGQVLLRIDPEQLQAMLDRIEAALSQARRQESQQRSTLEQVDREWTRVDNIWKMDSALVSRSQWEDAETNLDLARSRHAAAKDGVSQAQASVDEARDQLSRTTIKAPISGRVTRLEIELGETAIVGMMNNPGSHLLTIGDLSGFEVVLRVDETDIPHISLGDSAGVRLDAFPNQEFPGVVTEIGNSAIQGSAGFGQASTVDFEVVIALKESPSELRPDLSATADIVTELRVSAVAIPIIALTVRDRSEVGGGSTSTAGGGGGLGRVVQRGAISGRGG